MHIVVFGNADQVVLLNTHLNMWLMLFKLKINFRFRINLKLNMSRFVSNHVKWYFNAILNNLI